MCVYLWGFSGSVPTGIASRTELQLSLHDAVERGLKNNLGILLSWTHVYEAGPSH